MLILAVIAVAALVLGLYIRHLWMARYARLKKMRLKRRRAEQAIAWQDMLADHAGNGHPQ